MTFDQQEFDVRFEWGERGVNELAPLSDVVVIVDVLSFSTSVEIAVNQGAVVWPCRWREERAAAFAASIGAILADPARSQTQYSLSPTSLRQLAPGTRLVLPSPNGATLSLVATSAHVLAGCLRNARATARAALHLGKTITVIAAGERWREDHSLRPALEDLIGAGAILSELQGTLSPEARSAVSAFRGLEPELGLALRQCSSGKELIERGHPSDVELAAQLNVSDCVPLLRDAAFVRATL